MAITLVKIFLLLVVTANLITIIQIKPNNLRNISIWSLITTILLTGLSIVTFFIWQSINHIVIYIK